MAKDPEMIPYQVDNEAIQRLVEENPHLQDMIVMPLVKDGLAFSQFTGIYAKTSALKLTEGIEEDV